VLSVTSVAVINDAGLAAKILPPLEVTLTLRVIELLNTDALFVVAGAFAVSVPTLMSPVEVRLIVAPGHEKLLEQLLAVAVTDDALSVVVELILTLTLLNELLADAVTPLELLTVENMLPPVVVNVTAPVVSMMPVEICDRASTATVAPPPVILPVLIEDTGALSVIAPPPLLVILPVPTEDASELSVIVPPLLVIALVFTELPVDVSDNGPAPVVTLPNCMKPDVAADTLPPVTLAI
jgi:hypothetical protein